MISQDMLYHILTYNIWGCGYPTRWSCCLFLWTYSFVFSRTVGEMNVWHHIFIIIFWSGRTRIAVQPMTCSEYAYQYLNRRHDTTSMSTIVK